MSKDKSDSKESRQSQPQILREYTVKISPITSEILKIISITSIFFIGAGFIDLIMYVHKNNTILPLSFLSANDLTILIILPILLSILIVALPFIFSMLIYTILKDKYNGKLDFGASLLFIIFIIFPSLIYLFYLPYKIIKSNYYHFWDYFAYIIILILISLVIFVIKNRSQFCAWSIITKIKGYIKAKAKIVGVINKLKEPVGVIPFFITLLIFAGNILFYPKNNNYILILISQIFFFAIASPLSIYILECSSHDIKRDFSFLLKFYYGIAILFLIIYIILFKSSASFRMLTIGGNIPVKLEVSKKYLKKIDFNETAKSKLNKSLCKLKNNSKWVKFILFLKTPNNYYVKCEKDKFSPVFLIPVKYVYSEKFIQNKQKSRYNPLT